MTSSIDCVDAICGSRRRPTLTTMMRYQEPITAADESLITRCCDVTIAEVGIIVITTKSHDSECCTQVFRLCKSKKQQNNNKINKDRRYGRTQEDYRPSFLDNPSLLLFFQVETCETCDEKCGPVRRTFLKSRASRSKGCDKSLRFENHVSCGPLSCLVKKSRRTYRLKRPRTS